LIESEQYVLHSKDNCNGSNSANQVRRELLDVPENSDKAIGLNRAPQSDATTNPETSANIQTYALLNGGADSTFYTTQLADKLRVSGPSRLLTLHTMEKITTNLTTYISLTTRRRKHCILVTREREGNGTLGNHYCI
jgi:hypothetical protein